MASFGEDIIVIKMFSLAKDQLYVVKSTKKTSYHFKKPTAAPKFRE